MLGFHWVGQADNQGWPVLGDRFELGLMALVVGEERGEISYFPPGIHYFRDAQTKNFVHYGDFCLHDHVIVRENV